MILIEHFQILHHKASELNLNMRSDGFVKVEDLLKLNMKTFANVPLRSHTDDDVKETVESESQKQFFRPRKLQCVYTGPLRRIWAQFWNMVMRWDVDVLIFLDVRKALEEGMKLYISDNRVILTEGFDSTIPVKYFERIESWPDRRPIPFQTT
uniref:2'-phosphotransferase n=1 Tax=Populus alba TaxID=43335 RepID=A0A4U5PL34_POPAL|nr:hypothetical protein D5086_0000216230 [Populus alba]